MQSINRISPDSCSHGIVHVHLYKFFDYVLNVTTPSVVKSVQVVLKSGRWW